MLPSFVVKHSDEVLIFLDANCDKQPCAFSIDVKNLVYSLLHDELLAAVEECIDCSGCIGFQNASGISVSDLFGTFDLLSKINIRSVEREAVPSEKGICIGSCIAPILSDLFLARLDRAVLGCLDGKSVAKDFRYVDDYIVSLEKGIDDVQENAFVLLETFKDCLKSLELTYKIPSNNALEYLDT